MRSSEVERFKYNKNIYIAVIGKCGGCYHCVDACQEKAIKEWMPPTINHSRCTRFMKCVEVCPRNIMQIIR